MTHNLPMMRKDDFNNVIRDRFFVQLELNVKNKEINGRIIYIDSKGISSNVKEESEITIKPPHNLLLLTWITLVNDVIKRDKELSESIRQDILEGNSPVDEIDYPNEYTMWHSNWYKHQYLFLQPFYTYLGSLLRLSYLINELIEEKYLSKEYIVTDAEIKDYPVMLKEEY